MSPTWGETEGTSGGLAAEKVGGRKLYRKAEAISAEGVSEQPHGEEGRAVPRRAGAGRRVPTCRRGGLDARRSPGARPGGRRPPAGCRLPPAPEASAGPARRRHGGEPHPSADSAHRALRGPAAGRRRGSAATYRPLRGPAQQPAQIHPERAIVHRPARPPGLHHGGGQRRQVL